MLVSPAEEEAGSADGRDDDACLAGFDETEEVVDGVRDWRKWEDWKCTNHYAKTERRPAEKFPSPR